MIMRQGAKNRSRNNYGGERVDKQKKRMYRVIKRGLDVLFSVILLFFLWLPMVVIGAAVRVSSPGKAIFKQIRVGKDGKLFVCYKFRTMYKSAPPCIPSSQFADVERYITPIGCILRRSSLDELPQLLNVLKGDMSIVGPRPLIISETSVHKGRKECGVYSLRPGITGLSQISGRDHVSDEQKIRLDAEYLRTFGFLGDIRIVGKTFVKIITKDGVKMQNNRE